VAARARSIGPNSHVDRREAVDTRTIAVAALVIVVLLVLVLFVF
jgi:hypothetical protein